MKEYNLEEFANKVGTDVETLKKWNELGILIPHKMPIYTDEHYELYHQLIENGKSGEKDISTTILLKKEDDEYLVLIRNLENHEYIEMNRLKTYKNARIFAMKKKDEYESIGIKVELVKEI